MDTDSPLSISGLGQFKVQCPNRIVVSHKSELHVNLKLINTYINTHINVGYFQRGDPLDYK